MPIDWIVPSEVPSPEKIPALTLSIEVLATPVMTVDATPTTFPIKYWNVFPMLTISVDAGTDGPEIIWPTSKKSNNEEEIPVIVEKPVIKSPVNCVPPTIVSPIPIEVGVTSIKVAPGSYVTASLLLKKWSFMVKIPVLVLKMPEFVGLNVFWKIGTPLYSISNSNWSFPSPLIELNLLFFKVSTIFPYSLSVIILSRSKSLYNTWEYELTS